MVVITSTFFMTTPPPHFAIYIDDSVEMFSEEIGRYLQNAVLRIIHVIGRSSCTKAERAS
jgi:hypothetical protein